jgi:hypothetical protein
MPILQGPVPDGSDLNKAIKKVYERRVRCAGGYRKVV